jgi:N-acetylmuramoyl-L-alanine amidase
MFPNKPLLKQIVLWLFPVLVAFALHGCVTEPSGQLPVGSIIHAAEVPVFVQQDIYHQVARLETLWRISKTYGVDMQAVMQANGLKDPSSIKTGQVLLIPQATSVRSVIPVYNVRSWSHIVIHHTATEKGSASTIDSLHYRRGFPNGLGYHFLIDNGTQGKAVGQVEVGPRWIKQADGAHANAAGMNEKGIGIALIGNFSETRRVPEPQLSSLVFLVNALRKHYGIPLERVIRHRDVPGKNTECPGNFFPWEDFKRRLAESS